MLNATNQHFAFFVKIELDRDTNIDMQQDLSVSEYVQPVVVDKNREDSLVIPTQVRSNNEQSRVDIRTYLNYTATTVAFWKSVNAERN
jgi:hypothetical protein